MKTKYYKTPIIILTVCLLIASNPASVKADDGVQWISEWYGEQEIQTVNGTDTMRLYGSSPVPPENYTNESYIPASDEPMVMLENFPSYSWVYGCGAVSSGMMAAWYDRNGYPNVYSGPTNNDTVPVTHVAQKSL